MLAEKVIVFDPAAQGTVAVMAYIIPRTPPAPVADDESTEPISTQLAVSAPSLVIDETVGSVALVTLSQEMPTISVSPMSTAPCVTASVVPAVVEVPTP